MRLSQTLKTASFRLTAAYAILFTVSVGILAAVVVLLVTSQLDREFHARIFADSAALRKEFQTGGTPRLMEALQDRLSGRLVGGLDYGLFNPHGHRLYGTLPATRCTTGWTTTTVPPDGDEPAGEMETLHIYVAPLPDGDCLLVGDDIGKVRRIGITILKSFGWVALLSLMFAIGGGTFLSSRFFKRIEMMNRTLEAIIEGDMQRRIVRREAQDDLDRLAGTLNRMLDRITGLMDSLRHVCNDIAHDLRTPLGRLRRKLDDSARTARTPEEFKTAIDTAVSDVDSILDTFGAILRIAQIESGSRRNGFQCLPLSEVVADVCDTFTPPMEDAHKTLRQDIEPDIRVQGDRELLVQLLANLLSNAITHTPDGTTVTVSLRARYGAIELEVADNGPGVPAAERTRIFERFYRVSQDRAVAGNGLGLSIVAAVADLHGGTVSALDNDPGLVIRIRLPASAHRNA